MVGPAIHACAGCGYELDHSVGNRCPECGLAFDRSALEKPPHRRVPGAVVGVLLLGFLVCPVLQLIGLAASLVWNVGAPLAWTSPYAVLLARHVPGAAALALVVATMQGPLYGVVLALRSPPRSHPWTWALVAGTHACASFAAWALW
jgi:hypothetical protein